MPAKAARTVVREAITLEGLVHGPSIEVSAEEWLRLPERDRNRLLNTAKVAVAES